MNSMDSKHIKVDENHQQIENLTNITLIHVLYGSYYNTSSAWFLQNL